MIDTKRESRRTPIEGWRNRLSVSGREPGFEYRWVNDVDDRIETLKEYGWDIVFDKKIKVEDKRINNPTAEGSPIKQSVGGGTQAYLMRIKSDFFKEDQDAKMAKVLDMETSMKTEAKQGRYGEFKISRD